MLGKLIKNEIKYSSRYFLAMLASVAIVILLMGATLFLKVDRMNAIASIVLFIVGLVSVFMAVVLVIKNFSDTLYRNQGYLTFTLPVKGSELLFSKVFVSFFWIIVSQLILGVCVLAVLWNAKEQISASYGEFIDLLFGDLLEAFAPTRKMLIQSGVFLLVSMLLEILVFVSMVYFSITISNTRPLQKHPVLFGFLVFFAVYIASAILSRKVGEVLPLSVKITPEMLSLVFEKASSVSASSEMTGAIGLGSTVFMTVMSLVFLFVTGYIMERKVNIK